MFISVCHNPDRTHCDLRMYKVKSTESTLFTPTLRLYEKFHVLVVTRFSTSIYPYVNANKNIYIKYSHVTLCKLNSVLSNKDSRLLNLC